MLGDRETKLSRTIHAEMNAILNTQYRWLNRATLYVTPFQPCDMCAIHIIQAGIKRVVAQESYDDKWKESWSRANAYFEEAGVEVKLYPPLPHHMYM